MIDRKNINPSSSKENLVVLDDIKLSPQISKKDSVFGFAPKKSFKNVNEMDHFLNLNT